MARFLAPALVLLLGMSACTKSITPTTQTSAPSNDIGRLVVLDGNGNVVTLDPDGSNRVEITSDAGPDVTYFQPIWSPARDAIAWGEERASGTAVGITREGSEASQIAVRGFPFYLYWAPDGDQIGVLHDALNGSLEFEVVDVVEAISSVVDSGAPYYFSWSPDGSDLAVHVEGERFGIIDANGEFTSLGETSPNYSAPVWTEAGIFYLTDDGVALRSVEGNPTLVAGADGLVGFSATGDGSRLAIQVIGPSGRSVAQTSPSVAPTNAVSVLDVQSGDLEIVSTEPTFGFFWSPDGGRLLMMVPDVSAGQIDLVVWEEGAGRAVASLQPPASLLRDTLQFFDQYAQSWQMWAPDSNAFAVPGTIDGDSGIWVIPVDGGTPDLVSEGEWVAWSP